MIHTFSVSNYYSVREEVVLDLRILGTAPDLPRFRRSTAKPDIRLPSVVVFMGPNGSGKTTLLDALLATSRIASSASPAEETSPLTFIPFSSTETKDKPTRFCVEIEADWLAPDQARHLFRYELAVQRGDAGVKDTFFQREVLSYFPKGRPRRLFERGAPGESIYVSSELGLTPRDARLKAIRADASVIATLALLNVPLAARIAKWMRDFSYFSNIIHREKWQLPTQTMVEAFDESAPEARDWLVRYIQASDLGIQDVRILEQADKKEVFFDHRGLDRPIHLSFESSGTQRLFHLLPQLYIALNDGIPAVIDEVDGDLHVDIAGEMLDWFRSQETNPSGAQLFVSSHNVGLLDNLEKEEVFIVEKDRDGATRVYSAQDVRGLRRDARLYPKYRTGVLGGIPQIG